MRILLPPVAGTQGGTGTDASGLYRANDPVDGLYMTWNGREPGQVQPPPPTGDHPHYDAVIAQLSASGDLLFTNAFRTVDSIADSYRFNSPVLFTVPDPDTNPDCKWNGGTEDCFTVYRDTAEAADVIGVDNRTTDNLPPTNAPTDENAFWSAMYSQTADGARVLYPNDQNMPYLDTGENYPSPGESHLIDAYQWDFAIDKARFYIPQNTEVSNTYKYFRTNRRKNGENSGYQFLDDRLFDMRATWNTQTFELLPFFGYNTLGQGFPGDAGGSGSNAAPGSSFIFDKDIHGSDVALGDIKWFRCTLNLSTTQLQFKVWSYETQQNIWDTGSISGVFVLYDDVNAPQNSIEDTEFHPQQTRKDFDSLLDPRSTYTFYRNFVHARAFIPEVLA